MPNLYELNQLLLSKLREWRDTLFNLNEKINFNGRSNDVLAIGELLIDMIATDYKDSGKYQRYFGGAPANIAMNINKLGANSKIASAVGSDYLGDFLIDSLTKDSVDIDLIQRVEESTSMVMLNRSNGTPIPIFYRGADYQLKYNINLEDSLKNSKIMHFSAWTISKMPIRETMEKLIHVARENNTLICFDPNYHELLWDRNENGIDYIKSIISKSDIVKPSEDDAERIFGKDNHFNQLGKFLKLGAKLVVMTLGKEGLIAATDKEFFEYKTLATKVADTTGAGDAFWAGFYTALVKGYTIKDAVVLGSATSAYKLKSVGAIVDLPRLEVLKKMYVDS